jgi:hypothetical protein
MYDTLMQMGRWFGYRPSYLDLCRLFTTRTLVDWYRHIALAEEELRREFDYMVSAGLTPEKYGLRVRTHPGGMIVTALNKMCHGRTLELSWAGVLAQSAHLPKDVKKLEANFRAAEVLLGGLGVPTRGAGAESRVWVDVPADVVASFVESLQLPPNSARAGGEELAEFIRKQAGKVPAELVSWTVVLVSNSQAKPDMRRPVAGYSVGPITRNPESQTDTAIALKKANILSPTDEAEDFVERVFDSVWLSAVAGKRELRDDVEWLRSQVGKAAEQVALELTLRWQAADPPKIRPPAKGRTQRPNGRILRVMRMPTNGLLLVYPVVPPETVEGDSTPTGLSSSGTPLIGVALSFPTSETTIGVEYRVNKVWGAAIEDDQAYED